MSDIVRWFGDGVEERDGMIAWYREVEVRIQLIQVLGNGVYWCLGSVRMMTKVK